MKRSFILLFSMIIYSYSISQDCTTHRYDSIGLFDVSVTDSVLFGQNINVAGTFNVDLLLDVYEPDGDTISHRPAVIVAFGGSFVQGSRKDAYVVELCNLFAGMGYVAVAIDYRIGAFLPSEATTTLAVMRAMHDMKAAVRFLYKDAATVNQFKIDTNRIIVSGVSAGAVTAIHAAYLDEPNEIPASVLNEVNAAGGVEGNSGNPGFSSKVHGVVNLSGAIGDTTWMKPNDVPIVSVHDNGDNIVPYDTREVEVFGIPTGLIASGSGDLTLYAQRNGIPSCLLTYDRNGHTAYLFSQQEFDEVIHFIKPFMKEIVCSAPSDCNSEVIYSGIYSLPNVLENPAYPNPANEIITIETESNRIQGDVQLRIIDMQGKVHIEQSEVTISNQKTIDISSLENGMYIIEITSSNGRSTSKFMKTKR